MHNAGDMFNGKTLWYYEFTGVLPQYVIFSNNGASKTADLSTKGCDYVYDGSAWNTLTTTDLENAGSAPALKKYVLNGQIVIEINGIRYNALGQRIP